MNGWEISNFQDYMHNWFHKKVKFKELPLFIVWKVWKARNIYIFEDIKPLVTFYVL